tara:strand:+ start:1426 stop:1866 length:441 start_codon:yes stop_codon:yes gene_type:complete
MAGHRETSKLKYGGQPRGSCLSPGCMNRRGVASAVKQKDGTYYQKRRPFCKRCELYYRGKGSLKEGVGSVKKNYCENLTGSLLGFPCRTKHDEDMTLPNFLLDVDHRVPEKDGGSNKPSNVQTICKTCHRTKSMLDGDFTNSRHTY